MTTQDNPLGTKNLSYYCKGFSELNVSSSRQRGEAHYKPILLLVIIDLITQGLITENQILVSDNLIQTFNNYWDVLGSNSYKGGLYYPFIHLESDGFWRVDYKVGFIGPKPKTHNKLKEAVEYASLDDELFNYLRDPVSRNELIDVLISVWFSSNKQKIEDILQVNQSFQEVTQEDFEENLDKQPKTVLKKSVVRNAFFRKAVVHIYDYKCAFCHLKVMRTLSQSIVDGAHIKPFSPFYDSRINNGISLCKNHHWAFDRGWFGIDDKYKIIVAGDLDEISPNAKPMQEFRGETILLPNSEQHYPRLDALEWHRLNVFRP